MPGDRSRSPISAHGRVADRSRAPETRVGLGGDRRPSVIREGANALEPRRRGSDRDCTRYRRLHLLSATAEAHRQGHDRPGGFHQFDGRFGVRRDAATRSRNPAPAIAIPQPGLGGAYPERADADATAAGCTTDVPAGSRGVRPDRERRRARWIDREPRQSVRPRPAREELHDRRHSRRRAGAGGTKGRCPRRAEPDCQPVADASG